ncbi:surface array protein [Campylobacter fetus subsp. fetus]|nr:cell surface protein [Campylobacter fetus]SQH29821.1 surface array protein [Campylobacter fetus subsp. fetus]
MISKSEVSELFIVLFGRPTEGEGNTYWVNESSANGWGMIETSNAILNLDITKSFLGETLNNNESFVKHLFKNAVNLTEFVSDEQKAGLKYWVDLLDNGTVSKADLVGHFVNAAKDPSNAGANQDLFNNKVIVSNYVADTIAKLPLDGLTPDQQNALIQKTVDIINNVTSNSSSVESAKGEVDGLKESIDEAGLNKIALTTENDTITGTEGGDLISGVVGTAAESTLNPGDKIDGGAGNDVLKVDLKNNFKGLKDDGYIKNIEKLSLTNSSVSNRTFDAKGIDGLQTVALSGEKGISVTNLANIVDVELTNLKADKFNVDSIYADKVLDGSADVQNLKVNGVGAKGASVAITADKIETLNLNTTGSQSFVSADVASISVKGNANLSLATGAKTTTLDASSFGGALDADLSTSASVTSIKGGNGNDKITIGTDVANVNVDGGAGNDELVIKGSGTLKPTVANVEKVTLDATGDLTLAMNNAKDVSELNIKGDTGGVIVLNSNISSLNFLSTAEGTNAVTIDSENLATINYKAGTDAKAAAEASGKVNASEATNLTINLEANTKTTNTNAEVIAEKATSITLNVAEVKEAQAISIAAPEAVSLSINNKSAAGLQTNLDGTDNIVENLTISTDGAFKFVANNHFEKANVVTLSGDNAKSAMTLGNIGSNGAEHDIQITASGLKSGLTVGSVLAVARYIKENNVNVDVSGVTGRVALGNMSGSNVSVNANSSASLKLGNIDVIRTATVNAGAIDGAVDIGDVYAKTANIDLSKTLGNVYVNNITADTISYNGSTLKSNGHHGELNLASAKGKAFTAVVNGSLTNDHIIVKASDATESIKVSGNLDIGNDMATIRSGKKTNSINISELKATNLFETIYLDNTTESNVAVKLGNFISNVVWKLDSSLTTAKLSGDMGTGSQNTVIIDTSKAKYLTAIDISELAGEFNSIIMMAGANTEITEVKGSEKGNDILYFNVINSGADFIKLTDIDHNIDKIAIGGTHSVTVAYAAIADKTVDMTNTDLLMLPHIEQSEIVPHNNTLSIIAGDTYSSINLSHIYGQTTDQVITTLNTATKTVTLGNQVLVDGTGNKVTDIIKADAGKGMVTINGFDKTADKINFTTAVTDKGGLTTATVVTGVKSSDDTNDVHIKVAAGATGVVSFFKGKSGAEADSNFVATDANILNIAKALNSAQDITTKDATKTAPNGVYIVNVATDGYREAYSYIINIGATNADTDDTIIKIAGVADIAIAQVTQTGRALSEQA